MQRMSWRSFAAAQADPRRHKTKRAARAAPGCITAVIPEGLKVELLREPNHHQRKSNQKEEEARACAVVLRSHFRTAVRLVARPSGPSGCGNRQCRTEPRTTLPLCAAARELFRCAT
jgi:hypothetical protein